MASKAYYNDRRKRKRRNKKRRRIILIIVEILILLLLLAVLAVVSMAGKIKYTPSMNNTQAGINHDLESEVIEKQQKMYTNIAVFGVDNRGSGNYGSGNSDVIMIASIDNETKEVRLVSVYRDTYLNVGDGRMNKANSAYNRGGAVDAVKMLNSNLDLAITNYVTVDWAAVVQAIDVLDGIDLEVTKEEVNWLNQFMVEIDAMTGHNTKPVKGSGMLHLNGTQATAYSRIRSTAGNDFMRTSRQRIVLQAMLEKAKEADVLTLTTACNEIFDDIETNLDLAEIIRLAKDVKSYSIVSTTGFPFELTTCDLKCGDSVVAVDHAKNVSRLHAYLFAGENYVPSASVQKISNVIRENTGVMEGAEVWNTDRYNETVGASGTEEVKDNNKDKGKKEETREEDQ